MRFPSLIKPGTIIDQMVLNIDIAPTLIELAQATPIEGMHGQSLVRLFRGDTADWRTSALFEYFYEPRYPNIEAWQAVRDGAWKYIHYPNLEDMDELYHLRNDPHEMSNRINDPAAAAELNGLKDQLARLSAAAER